jgi:hypothetical protein
MTSVELGHAPRDRVARMNHRSCRRNGDIDEQGMSHMFSVVLASQLSL